MFGSKGIADLRKVVTIDLGLSIYQYILIIDTSLHTYIVFAPPFVIAWRSPIEPRAFPITYLNHN